MEHFNVPHSVPKRPRSLFREIKLKEKKVLRKLTSDGESPSTSSGLSQSDNDDLPTRPTDLFGTSHDVYITVEKGPSLSAPRHKVNVWAKPNRSHEEGRAKPTRSPDNGWVKSIKAHEHIREQSSALSFPSSFSTLSQFPTEKTDFQQESMCHSQTPIPSPPSSVSWTFTSSLSNSPSSSSLHTPQPGLWSSVTHPHAVPPTSSPRRSPMGREHSQNTSADQPEQIGSVLKTPQHDTDIRSSPSESIIQHQENFQNHLPSPSPGDRLLPSPFAHPSPLQPHSDSHHLQQSTRVPILESQQVTGPLQGIHNIVPLQENSARLPVSQPLVPLHSTQTPSRSVQNPVHSPDRSKAKRNLHDDYRQQRLNNLSPGDRRFPFENLSLPKVHDRFSEEQMPESHERAAEHQEGFASKVTTQRPQQSMEILDNRSNSGTVTNFEAFKEHLIKHPHVDGVHQNDSRWQHFPKSTPVSGESPQNRLNFSQPQYEQPSTSMDTTDQNRQNGPSAMDVQETPVPHNSLHRLPQNFCFQSGSVVQTPNGLAYLAPMIVSPKAQDNFKFVQSSFNNAATSAPTVNLSGVSVAVEPAGAGPMFAPLPGMVQSPPQAPGMMQLVQCMPGVFQPVFFQNQLLSNQPQQQVAQRNDNSPFKETPHQPKQQPLQQQHPQFLSTQNLQEQSRARVTSDQPMGSTQVIPTSQPSTLANRTESGAEAGPSNAVSELPNGVILDPVSSIPGMYIHTVPDTGQIELERRDIIEGMMLCQICEDRATGLHYGIITCEGCKGFFKRSVQNKRIYTCVANEECAVIKSQRNRCQFCRFKKCLQKGMVAAAVREDRMPGGRNSGAVYNLYKFKYKRHRRRTSNLEYRRSNSDKSDNQSVVSDQSDNFSQKASPVTSSLQSRALLKEERLKQREAGNAGVPSRNVSRYPETDQRGQLVTATVISAKQSVTLPAGQPQGATSSNDRVQAETSKSPNMILIEKNIACECFRDITRFAYRVEHESNVTRMLGNLGSDIVTHLVHWAQKLPFFNQMLMPKHLHILTSKWHEILFLTTATYQTIVENGRSKQPAADTSSRSLQLDFKRKLTKNMQRLHMYMTRRLRQTMTLEQLQAEVQQVMESVTLVILNFARLKVTLSEYICLKVILLLNLVGKDCTELTCSIQQQYMDALEEYTTVHFPENPNRFGELILLLSEVQSASALLLQSRMIFVPFLLSNLAREHTPSGPAGPAPGPADQAEGRPRTHSHRPPRREARNGKNPPYPTTSKAGPSEGMSNNSKQSTSPIMMSNAEQFQELHIE